MNLEQLESQLTKVTKRKQELLSEIKNSPAKRNIVNHLGKSPWYYNQQADLFMSVNSNELTFSIPGEGHMYLSYSEPNVEFSKPPSTYIDIDAKDVAVLIDGEVDEGLDVTLFVIGYKNRVKVEMLQIKQLNELVRTKFQVGGIEDYRIALRIKGKGLLKLNSIQINETVCDGFSEAGSVSTEKTNSILQNNTAYPSETQVLHLSDFDCQINLENDSLFISDLDEKVLSTSEDGLYSNLNGSRFSYVTLFENTKLDAPLEMNPFPFPYCSSSYYQIGFSAKVVDELLIDLIIIGFSSIGKTLELKTIPLNENHLIKFNEEVKFIKPLLRVRGKGKASDLKMGLTEIKKESHEQTVIEMDDEKWFNPKPIDISTVSENDNLFIAADQDHTTKNYLSYDITNNSFSRVPTNSIFPITPDYYYEIFIKTEESGSGMLTPIIISYSDHEKIQIHPLKSNELNVLQFKENVTKCRVSLLVNGTLYAEVNKFTINSYPIQKTSGDMKWISSKEPGLFNLNGLKPINSLKMAAIFDEFTAACYGAECDLISFGPDNWKEILTQEQPDLLMVESAWRGNDGAWAKKVQYVDEDSVKELSLLIKWCRDNNIPTVFWNKEDPVHFEHFIDTAKMFDYVFTTDRNVVEDYKIACGHNRVDVLQFAAQPKIHNPLSIGERQDGISFAGSYYKKHEMRSVDMLRIFDHAIPYGLSIYDRNYEKIKQGLLPNNRFPDYLEPYIKGSLKYYEIDKAYKGFKAMINVSTVKDSPTMFARRVYEGLASGTPIISTYSVGVEETFGDLVSVSEDEANIAEALENIFNNKEQYETTMLKGIRRVLNTHTYTHRLERIINKLNLPYVKDYSGITVISLVGSTEEAMKVLDSYQNQTLINKELHLITKDFTLESIEVPEEVFVFTLDDYEEKFPNILDAVETEYIALMDPYTTYGRDDLLDLSLATSYAPWEILGITNKSEDYFKQIGHVSYKHAIIKKTLFDFNSTRKTLEELLNNEEIHHRNGMRILGIPSSVEDPSPMLQEGEVSNESDPAQSYS
ncbi:hypothetical protein CR194_13065 [Salipaludibacillus keqinensis]|uniref:Spore protein YkvP/CgeB glycosyl transferase-like domain-containing protein n=1 Tax=Salipaludibacillus keqinensis TaxID=2045207 RepID=A0A323TT20_9BACI|nr:glycosyltransferase [Salipaludibacillus keqinensis]PYZ92595.1 hypothetical protein CR194_13065 [Salipaludibacillus keqinensis]